MPYRRVAIETIAVVAAETVAAVLFGRADSGRQELLASSAAGCRLLVARTSTNSLAHAEVYNSDIQTLADHQTFTNRAGLEVRPVGCPNLHPAHTRSETIPTPEFRLLPALVLCTRGSRSEGSARRRVRPRPDHARCDNHTTIQALPSQRAQTH